MKSCLTNLIGFYDEMIVSVDEGKAVDVVCLLFIKVLDTISHNFLTDKLMNCRLDKQTVRCIGSWLNFQAHAVISGMKSS